MISPAREEAPHPAFPYRCLPADLEVYAGLDAKGINYLLLSNPFSA
jgi:hypothetical protein